MTIVRFLNLFEKPARAVIETRVGLAVAVASIITFFAIPIILSLAGIGVGSWLWASGMAEIPGRWILSGGICGLAVSLLVGGGVLYIPFSVHKDGLVDV